MVTTKRKSAGAGVPPAATAVTNFAVGTTGASLGMMCLNKYPYEGQRCYDQDYSTMCEYRDGGPTEPLV